MCHLHSGSLNLRVIFSNRWQLASEGMLQLKGHQYVGGTRASIYNVMPLASVEMQCIN